MAKIYTEISIDMNPESSSYGETLHEESFDYEGPMALLYRGSGGAAGRPEGWNEWPPFPPTSWTEYKATNPERIRSMSDDEKLQMLRNLTGDADMKHWEMAKYMPEFDERGFANLQTERQAIQREGAADIAGIGMKQQDSLLDMALKQESSRAKSGFAVTGNPMIDKQRENIYKDIDVTSGRRYDTLLDDVWSKREEAYVLKEDYQEDLGLRVIDYEDKLDAEDDDSANSGRDNSGR